MASLQRMKDILDGPAAVEDTNIYPQRRPNTGSPEERQRGGGFQPPPPSPTGGQPTTTQGPQDPTDLPNKQKVTNNLKKNLITLTEDIQKALDAPQAPNPTTLLSLLQRAQTQLLYQIKDTDTNNALNTILQTIRTTPPTPLKTWAQAAAQGLQAPPSLQKFPTDSHVITIRVGQQEEQERMKSRTNQEILQGLKNPGVIAVRKLDSGDLKVFAASKPAKEKLASDLGWIHKELPRAELVTQLYQVLIHGVRIQDFNAKDPAQVRKLQEENGRLHPSLKISVVNNQSINPLHM